MKILVTGSSGQLGETFKSLSNQYDHDFTFLDRTKLDIVNKNQVEAYFDQNRFDFILNCAAYTAVDQAENDEQHAFLVNETGVENLVKACEHYQMGLVHFSTDYVFEGNKNLPYKEEEATNPLGVYGRSKLAGEQIILTSNISGLIFRTSWLYAKKGKNFYTTMLRLGNERDEISVVSDQIGTPTHTKDLVQATLFSLEKFSLWKGYQDIYHFSNEGVASWYDFAKAIFEMHSIRCKIHPIPTTQYPTPAKRPIYSVLNKQKFKEQFGFEIKHWQESLLL